jgi:hypothetical protein
MEALHQVAEKVDRYLIEAKRGAVPFGNGVLVFGNDGYEQDPVARDEAGLIDAWLVDEGYAVEGSARRADGYTWMISAVLPTQLESPADDEVAPGRALGAASRRGRGRRPGRVGPLCKGEGTGDRRTVLVRSDPARPRPREDRQSPRRRGLLRLIPGAAAGRRRRRRETRKGPRSDDRRRVTGRV